MASKKARKAFHKRDRRLAKASGYKRGTKTHPKKVGHGAT